MPAQMFIIEARAKRSYGVHYPNPITKERQIWGMSMAGTDGYWRKYKLVYGDLQRLRLRIRQISMEYSSVRQRHPELDTLRLFEEVPQVRSTGIDYYNYCGRVDTVSRESVIVQYPSGSRVGLQRDQGFGFQGIIVRSEEPWSMEQFAMSEMQRFRLDRLHKGIALAQLGVTEPWRLRDQAERYLRALFSLAWNEYLTEQSMERFEAVIAMDRKVNEYALDTLRFSHFRGEWEYMPTLPFPNATGALQLWEHDRARELNYDETAPWWLESPKETETEVTAVRQAIINNGKGATITITTRPQLKRLVHPNLDTEHHMISYGVNAIGGVGYPQSVAGRPRFDRPIITPMEGRAPQESPLGWNGIIPSSNEWTSLQAEGAIPEPKLKVRNRVVEIPRRESEAMLAALSIEKPVLMFPGVNGNQLPALVLPRMYAKVDILPLFTGARMLKPIQEGNRIEGWVTQDTGYAPNRTIWGDTPDGFLSTPLPGRPIREGSLTELLPY